MTEVTGHACISHIVLSSPFKGFLDSSVDKESACNVGDPGSIPGSSLAGRSTGEGIDYPLQYSGLENSMDCIVTFSFTDALTHLQR